jgi:hypothetical protein
MIIYGDPGSPDFYEGALTYEDLSALAQAHLTSPPCNVDSLEHCDDAARAVLTKFLGQPRAELESLETTIEQRVADTELAFDEKITEIQQAYNTLITEFNQQLESIRKETDYKWLQQVLRRMDEEAVAADNAGEEL